MLISELEKQLKEHREKFGDVEIKGCRQTVSGKFRTQYYDNDVLGVMEYFNQIFVVIQKEKRRKRR